MLSVTRRIATITQPRGGYIPNDLFSQTQYDDNQILQLVETEDKFLLSLQGAAVDYLTRYMLFGNREDAFHISFLGARKLDEAYENNEATNHFSELLSRIVGIDDESIRTACQIVGYDVAYRMGIHFYKDINEINAPQSMVSNIRIMVNRGLEFLRQVGPVVSDEMTFEGGYTGVVSSGDGDYLTSNMLIDFKVSMKPFSNKWSLQLLMYYLLGIHSIHTEYQSVSFLCVFNPYENRSYIVNLSDISDETKYKVSNEVLGYKMVADPYGVLSKVDYSAWRDVDGTDNRILLDFMTNRLNLGVKFDVSKYEDGIHKISLNEYWYCLGEIDHEYLNRVRPSFRYVDHVLMIKKKRYLMFLSVTSKGSLGVLNGGRIKSASFSAQYYYENIERYAQAVLASFSKYWDALRIISKKLKSLPPSEKALRARYIQEKVEYKNILGIDVGSFKKWYRERGQHYRMSGRIHGCIVDLDTMNHIYVNPYDGKITPYYALSMYDKDVYINVKSLLADQMPEFLESFEKLALDSKKNELSVTNNLNNIVLISSNDIVSKKTKKEYSYDMYAVSNRLKPLQKIYDHKLIQVWYDDILGDDKLLLEDKYLIKPQRNIKKRSNAGQLKIIEGNKEKYVGQSMMQKGDRTATITGYRNYEDIDVVFEDGYKVKHISINKWKQGRIVHPDVEKIVKQDRKEKVAKSYKSSKREKYIGLTKRMKCGLRATVIDYIDCDHITIKFEDGLIKSNVRSDHFINGNVAHDNRNKKDAVNPANEEPSPIELMISNRESDTNLSVGIKPEITENKDDENLSFEEIKKKYKDMTRIMKDGSVVKVIKAVNRRNVMIQFEDGTIVKSISINRFLNGLVEHP
jgi:hypothetical protein